LIKRFQGGIRDGCHFGNNVYCNYYYAEADIAFNFIPMITRELLGDVFQVQDFTVAYGQE